MPTPPDGPGHPASVPPSPTELALRRAEALGDAGRWEQSLRTLHEVLAAEPRHPVALRLAAVAEIQLQRWPQALQAAQAAVAVDPAAEHGHRLASVALEHLGRHGEAVRAAREAVRCEPSEPYALARLASVLSTRRGGRREALHAAHAAVEAGPGLTSPLFVLALVQHRRGRRRAAVAAYEAVLRLEPGHADALNNLGALALNSHRLGRGARLLGDSLAADPQSAVARHNVDVLAVGLARRVWVAGLLTALGVGIAEAVESGAGEGGADGSVVPWRWIVLVLGWGVLAAWFVPTWRAVPRSLQHAVAERSRRRPLLVVAWVTAVLLLLGSLVVAALPRSAVSLEATLGAARVVLLVNLVVWIALRRGRPRE
ncbi:tetratricopeptide repeat protein [Kineococcus endophyticus]|uniref:Tetratricopeptide repeat protein n=1 Tax=Kineococcus endophyticus TaxID=1181883 RepID=A0ABV3P585_9ACTN